MVGLSAHHKIAGIVTENMLGHLYNDSQYWKKKLYLGVCKLQLLSLINTQFGHNYT